MKTTFLFLLLLFVFVSCTDGGDNNVAAPVDFWTEQFIQSEKIVDSLRAVAESEGKTFYELPLVAVPRSDTISIKIIFNDSIQ